MLRSASVSCLLFVVGASQSAFGGVLIGAPATGGISVPFAGGLLYQQIYDSGQFSGSVTITGITFFDTIATTGGEIDNTNYTISLSTSAKAVNGLSTVFADNRGADEQLFFDGILSGTLAGSELNISGTPFNYDPLNGNLLLEIVKAADPEPSGSGFAISLDSSNGGSPGTFSLLRSSFADGSNAVADNNFGLVTRFDTEAAAIPEPSTLALAVFGAVCLCGYWRRRATGVRRLN
jgi:hypothetical protein